MRRAALAVAVLAALVLGGCGIPANSDVRVLSTGPAAGPAPGDDNTPPPPPVSRDGTIDYQDFVTDYLAASAGDPEGWLDRVTKFMTPEAKRTFKPSTSTPTIQVVAPTQKLLYTPGESQVTLYAREVGTLNKDGVLVPSTDTSEHAYPFQVVTHSDGLYIDGRPQVIFLSEAALLKYYQLHTIYFWNNDNNGLVPDVRYLPLNVPAVQRPTMILNWLADGPADWLSDVAQKLPPGTTVPDNIPAASNDKLQISLNAQPATAGDTAAIDRLRRQLQWSLRPDVPSTLELKIGHQDPMIFTNQPYLDSNPAFRLNDMPDEFVVYNGVIHRLADSAHPNDPVPLIKADANRGVQSAALSSTGGVGHTFLAVVTAVGKGATPTLRVAAAPTGKQADLRPVAGLKAPLGHPVWAIGAAGDAAAAVGLITSQGRLYSFGTDGSAARPVDLQNTASGSITSISVAPDGHRIVLVAGGKLYRGELRGGTDGIVIPALSRILPPDLTSVSAVAWSGEGWLTVAGVRGDRRTTIFDLTIDGAQTAKRLDDIGSDAVTYLTAYPASPLIAKTTSGAVSYEAGGSTWNAPGYAARIVASELVGVPASTPPNAPVPVAPFFLQ